MSRRHCLIVSSCPSFARVIEVLCSAAMLSWVLRWLCVFACQTSTDTMLLSMRRAGEPEPKKLRFASAENECSEVDDVILQKFSVCSVNGDASKPSKKRSYIRQFGVTEKRVNEAEYVDISHIQQLLLDSVGKTASDRNRQSDSESDRQERHQGGKKSTLQTPTTPQGLLNPLKVGTPVRPHSQPSCSSDLYRQGRQIEYFSKGESPKILTGDGRGRMIPEVFPSSPLLQTPPFSTGGHSPNVEELFALWFGIPSVNAGELIFEQISGLPVVHN